MLTSLIIFIFSTSSLSMATGITPRSPIEINHTNREIIKGIELLYDWEFDRAEKTINQVIANKPKDPIGYFYSAMVSWARLEFGFWSQATVNEYKERINRSISVARKKIKNGDADSFTYFYLGGALGFKGQFELIEKKWLSSSILAIDAIDVLKICLKLDPDNRDVLYGLGIYDYYTAKVPGILKFLAYIFIHKGNKEEGLRKLHVAAEEAIYSTIAAKSLLLRIYLFMEPLYHKARPLAEELAMRFSKNARFKFLQGVTYIRLGMSSEFNEVLDFMRAKSKKEVSLREASMWGNRALYLDATKDLFHGRYRQARSKFDRILSRGDPSTDPAMFTWPLLKKGMSYDLEGEREKALKYYKKIVKLKCCGEAQILAEKYIKKAINVKNPFLGY